MVTPFIAHHEILFEELYSKSISYLQTKQDEMEHLYEISKYDGWHYDHNKALFCFTTNGYDALKINYEVVGTFSEISGQWLWSWANPHISDLVTNEMIRVRKYGEFKDFPRLYLPRWSGEQSSAWAMTAISAFLLEAEGAYRIYLEEEKIYCYLLFKQISRV